MADGGQVAAKCDSLINFCISIENTVKFAYSLKRKPLVVDGVSRRKEALSSLLFIIQIPKKITCSVVSFRS
jgi:hypothetical protein